MHAARLAILRSTVAAHFWLLLLTAVVATGQNVSIKDELAAIERARSSNQVKLSRYTWQQIQFTLINGKAVDYRLYSVRIGTGGRDRRKLITENTGQKATFEPRAKEELSEYGPYAQQLCELAGQYTVLNSERVVKADARGELTVLRDHDTIKLSINNYLKPGDFLETIINQRTLLPVRMRAKSYLGTQQEAVSIKAEFAELPDGTNHVSTSQIDSASKHLTVKLTDWSYQ